MNIHRLCSILYNVHSIRFLTNIFYTHNSLQFDTKQNLLTFCKLENCFLNGYQKILFCTTAWVYNFRMLTMNIITTVCRTELFVFPLFPLLILILLDYDGKVTFFVSLSYTCLYVHMSIVSYIEYMCQHIQHAKSPSNGVIDLT